MATIGRLAETLAAGTGFIATAIAVSGFLSHVIPALAESPEGRIRRATAAGGLAGGALAVLVIVLSALEG